MLMPVFYCVLQQVCAGSSCFVFKHVCAEYFSIYYSKSVSDVLQTVTQLQCTFEAVFKMYLST